jgi:hypothetical protein
MSYKASGQWFSGKSVQTATHSITKECKESGKVFTTNSNSSLQLVQKDKTLGEPPQGLGSPEVAHRTAKQRSFPRSGPSAQADLQATLRGPIQ